LPLVVVLVAAIGKDQSTNRHPRAIQLQFFLEDGQFIFQPKFGSSLSLKSDALYHCIPSPLWLLCSQEEKRNHPTSLTPPPPLLGHPLQSIFYPARPPPPFGAPTPFSQATCPAPTTITVLCLDLTLHPLHCVNSCNLIYSTLSHLSQHKHSPPPPSYCQSSATVTLGRAHPTWGMPTSIDHPLGCAHSPPLGCAQPY
jgi:hypothetical protein